MKKTVDNGVVFEALLTDLSKAFDCILHDLIIAKLETYGFHIDALKLIQDYLSNRKQRVKVMMHIAHKGYILCCPTGIPTRSFIIQYAFM